MSRISLDALARAIKHVSTLSMLQKEAMGDEIFRAQPNLLGSVLVLQRLGVSLLKIEFLLDILLICFQAMKESGHTWPMITLDQQDTQMQRLAATVKFGENLGQGLQRIASQQYIDAHPEKYLLAYVINECTNWLSRVEPEESDKHVLLAAINLVSCIALLPATTSKRKKGNSHGGS